jgi:hypothetical protein
MKLYTEADLKKVISIYSEEYKTSTDEILKELNLTPIELPTDEDIWDRADEIWGRAESEQSDVRHLAFMQSAKWMRNKIQGGEQ